MAAATTPSIGLAHVTVVPTNFRPAPGEEAPDVDDEPSGDADAAPS